ncbi:hypothetical protein J437_LFUL011442 [Ladona fulva]|uniref:Zinc finger protein ush n=1 Tax=Ladona fulva TaxID=123851 RepID=A0A8K0KFE9_LADFU|nr:hypothetical protein J437_LFUL011442 [Ladona fulva]
MTSEWVCEEEEAWVDSEGVREATPAASEEKDAAALAMSSQPERAGPSPRREENDGERDGGSEGAEERAEASPKGAGEDEGGGGGDSPRRGVTKSLEEERTVVVREVGGVSEKKLEGEVKVEEDSGKGEEERKVLKKETLEERETILVKNEDEEDAATPGGGCSGVADSSGVPRGSPNSASVISSPPSQAPRVRLNPSLATDPAVRGPLPLSTHIPLTDFEYMLPPGLQASTAAAAAAAAAFAAAGGFFFPPPHPATPRAPATTPPHPIQTPVAEAAPALATRTPNIQSEGLEVRQVIVRDGLYKFSSLSSSTSVPVFVCAPCGIKFSNASTLEAHQTYYCSHRNSVLSGAVVPGGAAAVHPGHSPAAPAPAGTPGPSTTPSSRPPPSPSSSSSSSSHATMAQTDAQQIRSVPTPSGPIRGKQLLLLADISFSGEKTKCQPSFFAFFCFCCRVGSEELKVIFIFSLPYQEGRGGGSESEDGRPFSADVSEDRRSPSSLPEEGCPPARIVRTNRPFSCPHCSYSADKKVSLNRHMRMHGGAVAMSSSSSSSPSPSSSTPPPLPPVPSQPPPPSPASGGVATQLHHLLQQGIVVVAGGGAGSVGPRGPDTPPAASSSPPDTSLLPPPPPLAMDRYCQDCDIRFSSVKTYRAHKLHYCSTRHAGGKVPGPGSEGSTSPAVVPCVGTTNEERRLSVGEGGDLRSPGVAATSSAASPSSHLPQVKQHLLQPPFVALPTNPVLLVPYAFLQSASLVVAGTPTPKGACILLPDGSLRPVSPPLGAVPLAPSPIRRRTPPAADAVAVHDRGPTQISVAPQVTVKPKEENSQASKPPPGSSPVPLDLSFRRDSSESQLSKTVSTQSLQGARRPFNKQSPREVDGGWEDAISASQGRRSSEPGSRGSCQASPPPSQQSNTPTTAPPIDHAHSPTSSTSSSAASSSPPSPATGPKARPSRPNGMSSSSSKSIGGQAPPPPPHPMFSPTPPTLPPHIQQQIQQLQQFGGAAGMESLGMANFLLAACAAAAAATAGGPDGMAKAAAAAVAGAGNAATQGSLPFLLTPELALRMVMGSAAIPEGLMPRVPPHLPPPQPPIPTQQAPPPPPSSTGPQVLVKQGVSKCVECNIVFCRHENYLAHKKHYCAARLVEGAEDSPTANVQGSTVSVQNSGAELVEHTTPEPSSSASPRVVPTSPSLQQQAAPPSGIAPPLPPKTLLQFICVACGIKFTAFDNLQAHQMYYCPKRDQVASVQKNPIADVPNMERVIRKCAKCKTSLSEEALLSGRHQCPATNGSSPGFPTVTAAGGWKCPCCDVLSPTAIAAQRHVETHAGGAVRAFRCTICRYRGNTLRGMRTHIRAHFEQRNREAPVTPHSPELQEENFIACILEDDSEVPPMVPVSISIPTSITTSRSTTPAADSDDGRMETGSGGEKMHYCEVCGYSSTYKGNVVRHLKLVHKCTHPGGPTEAGVMGPGITYVSGSGNASSVHSAHSPGGTPSPSGDSMVNGYGGAGGHRTEDEEEDMEVRAESLVKVEIMEVDEDESEDGIGKREVKLEGSEAEEERKSNLDREEGNSHDSFRGERVSPRIIKREAVSSCEEGSMGGDCSKTGSPSVEPEVKKEAEEVEEEEERKMDDRERVDGGEEGRKSADPPQSQQQQPVIKKAKYCKSCDISFNYLSTFIAHKKFYCSSHHPPAQGTTSPAPAISRVERGNHGASGNGRAEAATPVQ